MELVSVFLEKLSMCLGNIMKGFRYSRYEWEISYWGSILELVFHIELQWNDDIREDDMNGAGDSHRRENKWIQDFVGKPERRDHLKDLDIDEDNLEVHLINK
jgi:hypothetical protein